MRGALVVVAGLWLASLFVVAAVAREQAQAFVPAPVPVILSGADVGFRVEGHVAGEPAGTVVIRINGKWFEPRHAPGRPQLLGKPTE